MYLTLDEFDSNNIRVVALAGGVGGAKMAHGLQEVIAGQRLTVVVNVGDDFEHYGLKICPDLDTVCYTLSGQSNPVTGWGLVNESWNALDTLKTIGGPTWFQLGDRDLGTHLERTRRIKLGYPLSKITDEFCQAWGVKSRILPVTDQWIPTIVHTPEGDLSFQEYFVFRKCEPRVTGFSFENISECVPAPGVLTAIEEAALLVICPSNPFVSIDPILAVPGITETIIRCKNDKNLVVLAVSPIVGGKAIKGPAAKMFQEFNLGANVSEVAHHYGKLLDGFIIDELDREFAEVISKEGLIPLVTNTLMPDLPHRRQLADDLVNFGITLLNGYNLG